MKANSPILTIVSLLLGACLFYFVVRMAGSQELWLQLQHLDARFLWVLLVSGLRPLFRTIAWWLCLARDQRRNIFNHLWQARLIGDAIGNITTAGPLLAEPLRLLVLSGQMPFAVATASLSLELMCYLFSACLMMLIGLLALLAVFALDTSLKAASFAAASILVGLVGLLLLIVWRRWSLVNGSVWLNDKLIQRIGVGFPHTMQSKFERLYDIEKHILSFAFQRPRVFALVSACEFTFHLLGVLEIGLTLALMGVSFSWMAAFIFESVNRLNNIAFAFVPIKLGVDEAGTALLAQTLGFSSSIGVTLAIYRKLRVLFWTFIGLLLLGHTYAQRKTQEPESL